MCNNTGVVKSSMIYSYYGFHTEVKKNNEVELLRLSRHSKT